MADIAAWLLHAHSSFAFFSAFLALRDDHTTQWVRRKKLGKDSVSLIKEDKYSMRALTHDLGHLLHFLLWKHPVRIWCLEQQQPSWGHEVTVHTSYTQPPVGFETSVRSDECLLTVMLHLPKYVPNYSFRSHMISSRETYKINKYLLKAPGWALGWDMNKPIVF